MHCSSSSHLCLLNHEIASLWIISIFLFTHISFILKQKSPTLWSQAPPTALQLFHKLSMVTVSITQLSFLINLHWLSFLLPLKESCLYQSHNDLPNIMSNTLSSFHPSPAEFGKLNHYPSWRPSLIWLLGYHSFLVLSPCKCLLIYVLFSSFFLDSKSWSIPGSVQRSPLFPCGIPFTMIWSCQSAVDTSVPW